MFSMLLCVESLHSRRSETSVFGIKKVAPLQAYEHLGAGPSADRHDDRSRYMLSGLTVAQTTGKHLKRCPHKSCHTMCCLVEFPFP